MGWQQEQAAARAREQQRQATQDRMSRQRADGIRAENEAASRANRQRQEAGWQQLNARNEKQRQQNQAAGDAAAERSRRNYAKMGQTNWAPWSSSSSGSRNDRDAYPSGNARTKKKGGSGVLLFVVAVVGIIIFANSNSSKSTNTGQLAPITYSRPQQTGATTESLPASGSSRIAPDQAVVPRSSYPSAEQNGIPEGTAVHLYHDPPADTSEPPAPVSSPPPLQAISRVSPQYPEMARLSGLRGTIAVTVEVSTDGTVVRATPQQGNPLLVQAAEDAARKWRFNSYAGQPGDPLRTTTINFKFGDE